MKKTLFAVLLAISSIYVNAKDYQASLFGIKSDGITLNTRSIQKAIEHIHENGGGRLVFHVGRYLTGTIELKSNVTIYLREGAVLLGAVNPYDYDSCKGWPALIYAFKAENIGIIGKGMIDGQGRTTSYNYIDQIHKGIIKDDLKFDRPNSRPTLIYLRECTHIEIKDLYMKDSAFWVSIYDQCKDLAIDNILVKSKAFWNNDGIDIVDCDGVILTNSFFDASDDAICLKSHDPNALCQNVEIRNCVARSSASGVKFGTYSKGGFKNIKLSNITVYDTYRSAFTIQAVDGGLAENITIDSLLVYNTGNVIFLRIGDRYSNGKKSSMKDILISNVYAEISEDKPDTGYEYEGPIEDLPRNISPCSIVGLKDCDIENITLKNIHIVSPGGGNPHYAKVGLSASELDAIPEMANKYPEYSQFKELPAWGFYIRHAQNVVFDNVTLEAKKMDYRPSIVLDDVKKGIFKGMVYKEPVEKKEQLHVYKSIDIKY